MDGESYYRDESVVIYNCDARVYLAAFADAIDLTCTDPPYGIVGSKSKKGDYKDAEFDDSPEYVKGVVVPIIEQCIERSKTVAVSPGIRNMFAYPVPRDMGGWYTPAASARGPFGFGAWQPILFYGQCIDMNKPTAIVVTEKSEVNGHPCVKPYSAWRWLVNRLALPGAVVFDPFMGSGTTLRVAKDLGMRAIGCEISERYCEIAAKRMAQQALSFV